MSPLKSTRLAWTVAAASLMLWAFSAPLSWGRVAADAAQFFDAGNDTSGTDTSSVVNISQDVTVGSDASGSGLPDLSACPPLAQVLPTVTIPPTPPASSPNGSTGTFRLCGPDAQAEQAIAQLIGGRGFSSVLTARNDGCADLSIRVTSSGASNGSVSSNLNVSVGGGRTLSIKIVSEGGATRVSIGANQA